MIKLIKSTFYKEAETKSKLAKFILNAPMLSFGRECNKFELAFSKYQKRKYCVFLNSGSSANLALIQALINSGKLKKGDKVGFSALTWSTNVMPIIQLGLSAIPIDVELDTLNVSPSMIKKVLKKYKLKAIFITNLLGLCDDIEGVRKLCENEKIILLEDNCESLGTRYKKKLLGNFGLASTCSFYVGHHMSTIEGGMVSTDSLSLANHLRIVRAHGWDRNLSQAKQSRMRDKFKVNSTFYSRYTFYEQGYNLRPTEINGFIGNTQIKFLDEIISIRNRNFIELAEKIYSRTDKYYPIRFEHIDFVSNFAVPIICKTKKIRDSLVEKCEGKIEIRPIVGGDMTNQPFFATHKKGLLVECNNARLVHEQGLYFGNNPELTQAELKTLVSVFTK